MQELGRSLLVEERRESLSRGKREKKELCAWLGCARHGNDEVA